MTYDVEKVRAHFPFFKAHPEVIYLDSAATSLKPTTVLAATHDYYAKASLNPHNVDSVFADRLHTQLHQARAVAASFMGASVNEMIFTAGATDALNMFATGLDHFVDQTSEILVPVYEHTSNLLPWLMLAKRTQAKFVPLYELPGKDLAQALITNLNSRTKIVAFTAVSNLFGTQNDFVELATKIKMLSPQACVVVDATQAAPHGAFDLSTGAVDLLAFSAHKVFGPTGVGIGYISMRAQTFLAPSRYGGGMSAAFDVNTLTIKYRPFPECYEAGTPNVAGILGTAAALTFFQNLNPAAVVKHEQALTNHLIAGLKQLPGVTIANEHPDAPIVSFNLATWHPQDVARCLGQKNIIVRAGTACVDAIKTQSGAPHAYVRVSVAAYTTKAEIDTFLTALRDLKRTDVFTGLTQ